MAETHTHYKRLMNPNYLGAYALEDGRDIVLTIGTVRPETVIGVDAKKEECIVCHWVESEYKPMILNSTNCKTISKVLGTPYIEEWAGHRIQIGIERVRAFGDITDALRVRKMKPAETAVICEVCGKPIQPANGMTPEQLAAYTASKYKKKMCAECAKKEAANK